MLRMEADPRHELAALVRAFRDRLRWELGHGVVGVATAPAPRFGVAAGPDEAAAPVAEDREVTARPSLEDVRGELGDCQRCQLAGKRHTIVFGEGSPDADVMFIGEAPGHDEDVEGRPFVGAAGQLLTKMIKAMGLERDEVYIANIIKCRPPGNRDPGPDEIDACEPFLRRQIDAIGPRMIIALGNAAAKTLLRTDTGISQLRGRFHTYHGIPLMPTFHPAFLLRNPERKRPVWEDLKMVMAEMDRLGLRRRSK